MIFIKDCLIWHKGWSNTGPCIYIIKICLHANQTWVHWSLCLEEGKQNMYTFSFNKEAIANKQLIWIHTLCVHYVHAAANLNLRYSKYAKVARVHYFCTIALQTSRAVLTRAWASRPGGPLVFQVGYHPRKRTFKTHPKHVFFRYENRP